MDYSGAAAGQPQGSRDPLQWTAAQVADFLRSVHLPEPLVERFLAEDINGMVFLNLTKEKLMGPPFNIHQFSPLETILGAVRKLAHMRMDLVRNQQVPPSAPPGQARTPGEGWQQAVPQQWGGCAGAAGGGPTGGNVIGAAAGEPWLNDGGPPVGMAFPMMPPPPLFTSGFINPHNEFREPGLMRQQQQQQQQQQFQHAPPHQSHHLQQQDQGHGAIHPTSGQRGRGGRGKGGKGRQPAAPEQPVPEHPTPEHRAPGLAAAPPAAAVPGPAAATWHPAPGAAPTPAPAPAEHFTAADQQRSPAAEPAPEQPEQLGAPLDSGHSVVTHLRWHPVNPATTQPGFVSEFPLAHRSGRPPGGVRLQEAGSGAGAPARVDHVESLAAPLPFRMVKPATDLKRPPSNWLNDDARIAAQYNPGKLTEHSREFAASALIDVGAGDVGLPGAGPDFIAPAEDMKQLFMAPFTEESEEPFALSIHRVGNTLVLDGGQMADESQAGSKPSDLLMSKLLYYSLLGEAENQERQASRSPQPTGSSSSPMPQLHQSPTGSPCSDAQEPPPLAAGSPPRQQRAAPAPAHDGDEPPAAAASRNGGGALQPVWGAKRAALTSGCPTAFQRTLRWQFRDLNLLLGSNHPIMRHGDTGQEVMLHLRDVDNPITAPDAMEFWIDNVMSNVPQAAVCFHKAGVIQGYQLISTADLPSIAQHGFEPQVVQEYAGNVLRWLKRNCTREAGSYVLIKDGRNLKLYDLSRMYSDQPSSGNQLLLTDALGQDEWDNVGSPVASASLPFAFPVGMLCLRMGLRMLEQESLDAERALDLLGKAAQLLSADCDDHALVAETYCALATAHVLASAQSDVHRRRRRPRGAEESSESGAGDQESTQRTSLESEEDGLMGAHTALMAARQRLRHRGADGLTQRAVKCEERLLHCRLALAAVAARRGSVDECLERVGQAEQLVDEVRVLLHSGAGVRALAAPPAEEDKGQEAAPASPSVLGFGGDPPWLASCVARTLDVLGDAHQLLAEALLRHPADGRSDAAAALAPAQAALDGALAACPGGFLARCNPLSPDVAVNSERAFEFFRLAMHHTVEDPDAVAAGPEVRHASVSDLVRKQAHTLSVRAAHSAAEGRSEEAKQLRDQAQKLLADDAAGRALVLWRVGLFAHQAARARQVTDPKGDRLQEEAVEAFTAALDAMREAPAGGVGPRRAEARRCAARAQLGLASRRIQQLQYGADEAAAAAQKLLQDALNVFAGDGQPPAEEEAECHALKARLCAILGRTEEADKALALAASAAGRGGASNAASAGWVGLLCDIVRGHCGEAERRRLADESAAAPIASALRALKLCGEGIRGQGETEDHAAVGRLLQQLRSALHEALESELPRAKALYEAALSTAPRRDPVLRLIAEAYAAFVP